MDAGKNRKGRMLVFVVFEEHLFRKSCVCHPHEIDHFVGSFFRLWSRIRSRRSVFACMGFVKGTRAQCCCRQATSLPPNVNACHTVPRRLLGAFLRFMSSVSRAQHFWPRYRLASSTWEGLIVEAPGPRGKKGGVSGSVVDTERLPRRQADVSATQHVVRRPPTHHGRATRKREKALKSARSRKGERDPSAGGVFKDQVAVFFSLGDASRCGGHCTGQHERAARLLLLFSP